MRNEKGSVLIIFLWALIVLSFFAVSAAVRTRLATKIEGYEQKKLQRNYDYLAAVNLARYFIEQDSDPEVDFKEDSWYGTPKDFKAMNFKDRFVISIADEESKININSASSDFLRTLFVNLKKRGIKLKGNPDDMAAGITAWRGGGASFGKTTLGFKHKRAPFESLEELYLVQYIQAEDVPLIEPYLTVYGTDNRNFLRININTADPVVLEAVLEGSHAGNFAVKTLMEKIERFRNSKNLAAVPHQVFQQQDLDAARFLDRLELSYTAELMNAAGFLMKYLTVDSRVFHIEVRSKSPGSENYRMEAVLGARMIGYSTVLNNKLDILAWSEGISL